jgi:general secretion pathway protein H
MIGAPDRDHSSGSTLFELLVVLAVIMLLIAVSVPMSKGRAPEAELRVKAQEISALMRLARTVAIRDNREIAVAVDVKQRRVELSGTSRPVVLSDTTGLEVVTARGLVVGDKASFVFTPQGGSTGGRIELRQGKMTATIVVSWLTADVRTLSEAIK